jgi:deoxyadenosine/deoxycytidine kinase
VVKRPFFCAIEGVIGVGKTTLARLLQSPLQAELLLEAFEENPFLSDFYTDRTRYAFQTQMFFLLSRYRQQQAVSERLSQSPLIADYIFAKDRLFAGLNLGGDEWHMYQRLYDVLAERVFQPDLVIYLRASTDVLMMRIAMRDRAYERDMDRAYIESLRHAYERYFTDYARTPLLVLDTDDLDYVRSAGDLRYVEERVRRALGIGVYQQTLPEVSPTQAPAPPSRDPVNANWALLERFLTLNEVLGRVGTALTGPAGVGLAKPELQADLSEAMAQLQHMVDALEG